jgi:hypothetical protein
LTGFGGATFNTALDGIAAIQAKFCAGMGKDVLLPWQPAIYEDFQTLTASCRYFTPSKGRAGIEVATIDPALDPEKLLRAVDNNKFKYTKDNIVGYFKRTSEQSEKGTKYL